MLSVHVSVISEPTVPTLVQESPSIATATTLPPLFVSTTPFVPQQTTTPIPTQPITTDAPIIITTVPESNALNAVEFAKLEKDVSELKIVDHFTEALAILKSQVPSVVDNYLGSKVGDNKDPRRVLQRFYKSRGNKLRSNKSQSLLSSLLTRQLSKKALIEDKNALDKGVADTVKDHKRKHGDDEDPPAGPNQGKKTKRRRTKASKSSKKPSSTKETLKGKAPTKGSKTGKSTSVKEPVEEPIVEVVMDDAGDDVAHDDNQPKVTSETKNRKTLNRPPTYSPTAPRCNTRPPIQMI
ncbi:hypothetical protein Tco_0648630 [Tanacetum coccineum]